MRIRKCQSSNCPFTNTTCYKWINCIITNNFHIRPLGLLHWFIMSGAQDNIPATVKIKRVCTDVSVSNTS